jgi:glycosyltransferase involved in cell wall biosynthesis
MRIAVVHSNADYLLGPRLPLLRHLRERFDVVAMAPRLGVSHMAELRGLQIEGVDFSLQPTGLNPFVDLVDTVRLVQKLRQLRLDAVLTNTIKPVTLGTFAAALAGVRRRHALISGLGFAFIDDDETPGLRKRIVRFVATAQYRAALALNSRVVFHNRDDLRFFVSSGICRADRAGHVDGSGVDTDAFAQAPPVREPVFVAVSRLLKDKGIVEYLEAARFVKSRVPKATFLLVGDVDANPSSLDREAVQRYVDDGTIEWAGAVDDVRPWLRRASVFVLPSYREGMPRSTLEAMAIGRAIVTTDVPGCRETVVEGANGLLVPARDADALAAAMTELALQPDRAASMGIASRRIVEERFALPVVHRQLDRLLGW